MKQAVRPTWSLRREAHALNLRDAAATPVLARIRGHRDTAPGSLRAVFRTIEAHLFEPGFNVARLCALAHEDPNNLSTRFRPAVGLSPKTYIATCRLHTGWWLLYERLRVWEIASVLGYRDAQTFSNAFTRWYGYRPTAYRKSLGACGYAERDVQHTALHSSLAYDAGLGCHARLVRRASYVATADGRARP